MVTLSTLEARLFQLSIFLIPTNLAYHWYTSQAYLNGHLVDYFLPKFYLSDIPIVILLSLYLFRIVKMPRSINLSKYIPLLLLLIYLISQIFLLRNYPSSIWNIIKLFELIGFAVYVSHYPLKHLFSLILFPIKSAVIFQCIVGLAQYIRQSSIFGYIFFGESDLQASNVYHMSVFGKLEVAPYGTTAHPNLLAGFLVISLVIICISAHITLKKDTSKAVQILLISLISIILVLTNSWGAVGALLLVLVAFSVLKKSSNHRWRMLFQAFSISSLLLVPLFITLIWHSKVMGDSQSILIRYELNEISISLLKTHPLIGIGPNQFIRYLPQTALSGQKTLFLQPPHNILLLILSETGLVGLSLVILCLYPLFKRSSDLTPKLPLIALLLIGSLDHYPLTLQTGQLLTALCLGIASSGQNSTL